MNRFKKPGFLAAALAVVLGVSLAYAATYPYLIAPFSGMGSRHNTLEFSIQVPSAGAAAIFAPGTTNVNALGSTSLRFSNVLSVLGNFSGAITAAAGITAAGPIVANGGVTVFMSTAPRTATDVASLYSSFTVSTGTLFIDSTSGVICMSSGTVQTSITVSTGTGACPH